MLKPLTELAGEVEHPEEEKTTNELWDKYEEKGEMEIVGYEF